METNNAAGTEVAQKTDGRRALRHPLRDVPGLFVMINKKDLHVDPRYQREADINKINKLAREWMWVGCGVIMVALRPDGMNYVMDGQHRVLAAMKREDVGELPCMVWELNDVTEEAKAFLRMNLNRKSPTVTARLPALITAGSKEAKIAEELIHGVGRSVKSGGAKVNEVGCLGLMMAFIKKDEILFRNLWPLIDEVVTKERRIKDKFVRAMFCLECCILGNESLTDGRWVKRLHTIGYPALEERIEASCRMEEHQGDVACGKGLFSAINSGLRTIKLAADFNVYTAPSYRAVVD